MVERGHRMIPAPGRAALYNRLGGGPRSPASLKPIYDGIASRAARRVQLDRVIAIGDGMPTDVRGALDYGLDLLYISHGIHAREYVVDGNIDEKALSAFLVREQASPRWWMPRLV